MSIGVNSVKFLVIEFFKDSALDSIHIVTNSIRHIIVMLKTVVFILLLICLRVKLLSDLWYRLLIFINIFRSSPDKLQNIRNVVIIPIIIGLNII